MKPANEIEIKRNIYSFSVLVLLLSVLIGSSAWTALGGAGAKWEHQLAERNARIDSLMQVVASQENVLKVAQDSVARLQAQLAAAQNNDLPRQVQLVTDFLKIASNKSGINLVDYVDDDKPTLGDRPAELVQDLLKSASSALKAQGRTTEKLNGEINKLGRSSGGGPMASTSNETKGNASAGNCEAEVKVAREEAEEEINELKKRLKAINTTRLAGLKELAKGAVLTAKTIDEPTEEALKEAMDGLASNNRQKNEAVWREYYNLLQVVKGKTQGIQ